MPSIVPIKVVSTKFLAELRARARSFANRKCAARIRVPDELQWWYFIEFGTAGRSEGPFPHDPGYYTIVPKYSSDLKFPAWTLNEPPGSGLQVDADGNVHLHHVYHPGIRPRAYIRTNLKEWVNMVSEGIASAVLLDEGQFRYGVVKEQLMHGIMPQIVADIGELLDQESVAGHTREDGKLGGASAGDEWREEAEIVDVSGES